MELSWVDLCVFVGFMAFVMGVSLYAGRKEKSSEDYFLAGRKLAWYLIGFSLIASNISTEHFVGMAGMGFSEVGMAIANWEWMSAICMVFIAWWLLPKFIKSGIYTMPQFLEYRYDSGTRTVMSTYHMALYVIALLSTVLFSGAMLFTTVFDFSGLLEQTFGVSPNYSEFVSIVLSIWMIGLIAASYTIYGGLKSVVWSDLLQGGGLIIGGIIVAILGLKALCGEYGTGIMDTLGTFMNKHSAQLSVYKPASHNYAPWVGTMIGGLWILNIHYWGLNQFITQRTLGAKSLAEGQKGVIFGAGLKLIIPFIVVIPGIFALELYGDQIHALGEKAKDQAYAFMIIRLLPSYLRGIMFAALCGAVMSTFNSGLNSAATMFTIDYYNKFVKKERTPTEEVRVGRITTAVIAFISCLWAPIIYFFEGVFNYIQEMWSFIAAGIVAAFLMGLIFKKAPTKAGKGALLLGPPIYAIIRYSGNLWRIPGMENVLPWLGDALQTMNGWCFLYLQMIVFGILVLYMLVVTAWSPLDKPIVLPETNPVDTKIHPKVYFMGFVVIILTAILYVIFWKPSFWVS